MHTKKHLALLKIQKELMVSTFVYAPICFNMKKNLKLFFPHKTEKQVFVFEKRRTETNSDGFSGWKHSSLHFIVLSQVQQGHIRGESFFKLKRRVKVNNI